MLQINQSVRKLLVYVIVDLCERHRIQYVLRNLAESISHVIPSSIVEIMAVVF